jgi:hypothetical protein
MNSKLMVAMTLAVALMAPLAGCASKGKISVAKLCKGAGGTYNMQAHECNQPAASHRKAADLCQDHGGYYDSASDACELGLE